MVRTDAPVRAKAWASSWQATSAPCSRRPSTSIRIMARSSGSCAGEEPAEPDAFALAPDRRPGARRRSMLAAAVRDLDQGLPTRAERGVAERFGDEDGGDDEGGE